MKIYTDADGINMKTAARRRKTKDEDERQDGRR